MKTESLTIRLTKEHKLILKKISKKERRSMGQIIEMLIEKLK